jgi:VWFA-related protein
LARELSRAGGKKAILLFTDGDDNSSVLQPEASIKEIQRIGVPVYCVLYGRPLIDSRLSKQLENISVSTGGIPFKIRDSDELISAFARVGQDLQNLYLLGYQSDNPIKGDWRTISVALPTHPKLKLRAKEGYWP